MRSVYILLLLSIFLSTQINAEEVEHSLCKEMLNQEMTIESMASSADEWDYKSNICEELSFHNIAESYRGISMAYENLNIACKNSTLHIEASIDELTKAKKNLENTTVPADVEFKGDLCSSFDYFLTTIDTI